MTQSAGHAIIQHLLNQVPVVVYQRHLDPEWTFTFCSDFIVALTGYEAADSLTTGSWVWAECIDPTDRKVAEAAIRNAVAQQQPFSVEYRIRHADGTWRWLCDRGQTLPSENGAPIQISGVLLDITADKQAEASRNQNAVTNRALINAIPDLMLRMWRDSTAYEIITPGNVNVVRPNETNYHTDLYKILPPKQVERRLAAVRQALDTGILQVYEQSFLRDGEPQWEEVRIVPCGPDETLVMIRDISDRQRFEQQRQQAEAQLRQSEDQFRSLVANIPGAVYRHCYDQHWTAQFFSEGIEDIYGYPADEFISNRVRSVASVIHPDDRATVDRCIHEAIVKRQPFVLEYRVHHPDGTVRWVYEKGQGVFDSQNTLLFLDGVVLDITERKQIQAQLEQLNQTLESQVEERTRALRASERDLRTLFDSVYEGILLQDLQGNILDVNRTFLELYSLSHAEAIKASLLDGLSSPNQSLQTLQRYWQQALAGSAQLFDWKARRPADNTDFDVEIYLQRVTLREREVILASIRDISFRKSMELESQQAERAAQVSQQFLQLVMDNIPQAIFWKSRDSVYLGCNQIFAEAAGLASPQEVVGKTDYDLPWSKEKAQFYRTNDRQILTSGQPQYHLLEPRTCADGHQIWCDTNKVPLCDSNGELIGILGTYEDITDRVQAEEALRESKQLLQLVMDNIPQYIFWKDRNSVYLGCNQNFARIMGLQSPDEVVGKTDCNLPWLANEAEEFRKSDRTVIETNTPLLGKVETQVQADGRKVWLETNKVPLYNSSGAVMGVLGTLEDITERKQAVDLLTEQVRLSSLQAEINSILTRGETLQSMLQACTSALVRRLSIAFTRIWTIAEDEVLELQASSGLYTHLNGLHSRLPFGECRIGRIAAQRIPHITNSVQTDLHISDPGWAKQEGIMAFAGYPLIVENQLLGVMGLFSHRPISSTVQDALALLAQEVALGLKRKQTETALAESEAQLRQRTQDLEATLQELQQTQMQLVQSEKMSSLGQLVAGVAHEINNPVNFIYGNLNHARCYIEDLLTLMKRYQHHYPNPVPEIAEDAAAIDLPFILEDLPKLLNSMRVGAERIQKIVLSLRTFSRMDEAEQKAVDIHAGINSTLMILQSRLKAQASRPAIEVIQHYEQMPAIECYAGQLNQVFMNILSNAIDALEDACTQQPDLRPQIAIATQLTQSDLVVKISDNGSGIPETVQARLFDPFFTTKPVGQGTGMGLSISYQIVTERHQGSLVCHSQLGQGTTFTITIPHRLDVHNPT